MKNSKIIFFLLLVFLFSCKKDKIKIATVSGTVLHQNSGLPLKGYTVYFTYYHNTKKNNNGHKYPNNTTTITDNNGHFTFENVEINESDDYSYELFVKSFKDQDFVAQQGYAPMAIPISKSDIRNDYTLFASPLFNRLTIKLEPSAPIIYPDSISIDIKNQFYTKTQPDNFNWLKVNSNQLRNNASAVTELKPMGLWRINILKVKNGITTNTIDSIFINFDETKTYTLSF